MMRKYILCFVVAVVACERTEFADSPDLPVPLISGFHSMYSPFLLEDRIWLGGWFEEPKRVPWPDKIYVSRRNAEGSWTIPRPIKWANGQLYPEAGAIAGFHINDPVILPDAGGGRWIMLYTAFPNDAIKPSACNPETNPIDCLEIERHAVGWLSSVDKGNTWEDQGIFLSGPEGVWSPGAVKVKDEIWVYYMDGTYPVSQSKIWRQRVDIQTMQPISARERVKHPGDGLSNVDVKRHGQYFFLAGNRNRASEVFVYRSTDGLNFDRSMCWPDPVLSYRGTRLDGPNIASIKPLKLLTGYNQGAGSNLIVSFQHQADWGMCSSFSD
jgi:hypothetical protein